MKGKSIPVTKSFLPPFEEYSKQLERVWENEWLTNRGELVLELEKKLKDYLDVSNILITNNGTIPLQIALKLLGNGGEIITTPFSYVATTAAIVWENCTPVFVDIDPVYWTIDETKIEESITDKTTAILATHVFGNPCNIDAIDKIAKKHQLKVIYDAAHCFGVKYKDKSIFEYGDISTCSFHATKLFHTGEGGAVFANNKDLQHKIYYSHNFGHDGPEAFHGLGINAKISELQAAMGLSVLPHMEKILLSRQKSTEFYFDQLANTAIQTIIIRENSNWNYSYFPVILMDEEQCHSIKNQLESNNFLPRRYFYPTLNTLEYVDQISMPISESISKRILCLPLFEGMDKEILSKITLILKNCL